METVEAVMVGASETVDGAQEVEREAGCPPADFERANVVVGTRRLGVSSDRALRGAKRGLRVNVRPAVGCLMPGDKAQLELFSPGEQARAHCAEASHPSE
ncbi:MAG: hypothetical protein JO069_18800 [Verrucomicrobia bacterium]|nr:hypothetical protein [Verrucomicrobiota bacterium]